MDNELKPCAHCGGKPKLSFGLGPIVYGTQIYCNECGIQTYYCAHEEAIKKWNCRRAPESQPALVELDQDFKNELYNFIYFQFGLGWNTVDKICDMLKAKLSHCTHFGRSPAVVDWDALKRIVHEGSNSTDAFEQLKDRQAEWIK